MPRARWRFRGTGWQTVTKGARSRLSGGAFPTEAIAFRSLHAGRHPRDRISPAKVLASGFGLSTMRARAALEFAFRGRQAAESACQPAVKWPPGQRGTQPARRTCAPSRKRWKRLLVASVAQLVEQLTLNQLVQGSSPCRGTTSKASKYKRLCEFSAAWFQARKNPLCHSFATFEGSPQPALPLLCLCGSPALPRCPVAAGRRLPALCHFALPLSRRSFAPFASRLPALVNRGCRLPCRRLPAGIVQCMSPASGANGFAAGQRATMAGRPGGERRG
jgi:hypothetical protein